MDKVKAIKLLVQHGGISLHEATKMVVSEPSLRDQFAMAALQGLLSNGSTEFERKIDNGWFASNAYKLADKMIEEKIRYERSKGD